jgi:hypothetical protein
MSSDRQNAPNPENLSLEKLSPELMAQVLEALAYPVIPRCPDGQQLGSGVLVEVDGVSGILTAEHVIFDKRFQKATGLVLTNREGKCQKDALFHRTDAGAPGRGTPRGRLVV